MKKINFLLVAEDLFVRLVTLPHAKILVILGLTLGFTTFLFSAYSHI